MSKMIKLVIVAVIIIGAMVWLAGLAGEQPLARQEKAVSADVLIK